jgi:hypothetical protein
MTGQDDPWEAEPPRWYETLHAVSVLYLKRFTFAAGLGLVPILLEVLITGAVVVTPIFYIMGAITLGGMAAFCFPMEAYDTHRRSRQDADLERLAHHTERVGGPAPEEYDTTFGERLVQVAREVSGVLIGAGLVEAFFIWSWSSHVRRFNESGDWGYLWDYAFITSLIPVAGAIVLTRRASSTSSPAAQAVQVRRAYREAVKDKEQLAGGLVLDEHARQVGGELTMRQEVGGLEVHEDVALGLDATNEQAEAVSEAASPGRV